MSPANPTQPTGEAIGSGWPLEDGLGRPVRERFLLREIVPRTHVRHDRTADRGAHQQRQLEIRWRSVNSGVEEVANRHEGSQHVHAGRRDDDDAPCTYGQALADYAGGPGATHVRVPIPCAHGGFVHALCMLDRADRIAGGHTDPRPGVACHSA